MSIAAAAELDEAQLQKQAEYVVFGGGCIADLRQITPEELEAVYALAYTELGQHHYDKAELLFAFLSLYDHRQSKHLMGLGASRQALRKYKEAAQAYLLAGLLERNDPVPPLQIGECLLAAGELDEAESALQLALHVASQDPALARAKGRAEVLLSAVRTRRQRAGESGG